MDKQLVISIRTIAITLLSVVALYIIYRLGPVFAVLLIAGLLVLALEPLVRSLMKVHILNKPVSRSFAVIIAYLLFIAAVVVAFTIGLPPVLGQAQRLINNLPQLLASLTDQDPSAIAPLIPQLVPQLSDLPFRLLSAVTVGFTTLATVFSVIVLSLYMSLDWENLKHRFIALFSDPMKEEVTHITSEVELNVGHWVKGQLILMAVVGVLSFIGLAILQVEYALALGMISGLLEIVPILGPVVAAILASIIGFADSPVKGLAVLALFIVIQQMENNLLVPKIMQRVSGFSPLVILIALLIGNTFFGILGAVLAVPATMVGFIIFKSVLKHNT